MAYSVDLREKAVLMIEKGKTKVEIAELMEIGIATIRVKLRKSGIRKKGNEKKLFYILSNKVINL